MEGKLLYHNRMKNDCVKNLMSFLVGLAVLLMFFFIAKAFSEGVASSYVASVFMLIALMVVAKATRMRDYVGDSGVTAMIVFSAVMVVFNLLFSQYLVFNGFLESGGIGSISIHPEHSLSYDQMTSITRVIESGGSLKDLNDLNLNQYQWLYTYYSLMFLCGGNVVTHICVFNMFHLGIAAIFMVLTAARLGVQNKTSLYLILFICLSQPVMDCLFAYHRDIVGQTALTLGMYIFVSTYNNNLYKILAFPIYAILFYSFRLQYLVVALVLFLWALFNDKRKGSSFYFGIVVFIGFALFIATQMSSDILMSFFLSDLNINDYVQIERLSFLGNLILGFVGFFPWTQLKVDPNWTYHLFAYLQGAMNITIVYYVLKSNWKNLRELIDNPVLLVALLLFVIAFFVAGHTSYVSVAIPFFAVGISNVTFKQIIKLFFILCVIYTVLSFVYDAMGLTGAGLLS